jgi:hypothetical protein
MLPEVPVTQTGEFRQAGKSGEDVMPGDQLSELLKSLGWSEQVIAHVQSIRDRLKPSGYLNRVRPDLIEVLRAGPSHPESDLCVRHLADIVHPPELPEDKVDRSGDPWPEWCRPIPRTTGSSTDGSPTADEPAVGEPSVPGTG